MARLTTEVFVTALIRQINLSGGNAAIVRKGTSEAGSIFLAAWMADCRTYEIYEPAIFDELQESVIGGRAFRNRPDTLSELELCEWLSREASFDPDCWLLEIENCPQPVSSFVSVVDDQ